MEDHDNYYDIILSGDASAIARLSNVLMPSSGSYSPVYNPGGPGNAPDAPGAAPGPFTVSSSSQRLAISFDLDGSRQATYVETDGSVLRNPFTNQPIGRLEGLALEDTVTRQQVNAYRDPQGHLFYGSIPVASDRASDLPSGLSEGSPIDLIDTLALTAGTSVTVSGSLSRSAVYASTLQFYEVLNRNGAVRDPATGGTLLPGDSGYSQAALSSTNLVASSGSSLSAGDMAVVPFSFSVSAGKLFAPAIRVPNIGETWFSFAPANSDGRNHFLGFGPNTYGIEDQKGLGDGDFDDFISRFSLSV